MSGRNAGLRLRVLGLGVCSCLASCMSYAGEAGDAPGGAVTDRPSRQENIGVVSGLAIGAVAAGPVGAVLGAAAGGWLGERYHRGQETRMQLTGDLAQSDAARTQLASQLAARDDALAAAQVRDAELDTLLRQTDQLGLDIAFRTDDDGISAQSVGPLLKLGALVASVPEASVRVAGYTDPRGSDAYNQELSLRRAQSVAAVLTAAGVPGERIVIEGHGKGAPAAADAASDADSYALSRRVTVRVELPAPAAQVAHRD